MKIMGDDWGYPGYPHDLIRKAPNDFPLLPGSSAARAASCVRRDVPSRSVCSEDGFVDMGYPEIAMFLTKNIVECNENQLYQIVTGGNYPSFLTKNIL